MFGIKLEDSASFDHQSKAFLGVRFVLLGFDPVSEQKVSWRLVNGGGIDVGNYGPACTHVIVNNLAYDDPICVAAQRDGKVLVTGLWVDHSFDVGMPVDPTSVMYRPLKGKDGIPGAKSLIVCLTGYQRQDRDDIMTMVGLMGASFSKPLVANKVTHLICYKFEGEKYELAKKIKRIKLVNHRWLEDCLKAWTILPEDDYNKSGYELEMMEAEAKDSEEEDAAQESVRKQNEEMKNVVCPNTLTAMPRVTPQSKENYKILVTSSASKGLPLTTNNNATASASGEQILSVKTSNIQNTDRRNTSALGLLDPVCLEDAINDELYSKTPTSPKEASNLITHSDEAKLTSLSYSRKISGKSTLPGFEVENRSNLCSSSKVDGEKVNAGVGFAAYSSREEQPEVGTETGLASSPSKEEDNSLSRKRKMDVSYGKSKLPKLDRDSKACYSESPLVSNATKGSASAFSTDAGVDKNASLTSQYTSPVNITNVLSSSRYSPPINMTRENISGIKHKSLPISFSKLEEPRSSSFESENKGLEMGRRNGNNGDEGDLAKIENAKLPTIQQEAPVPFPEANSVGIEKSSSPRSDPLKGKDGDSLGKPVRKKVVANRTWDLESKRKVGLGKAKKQKGSIYLKNDVSASTAEKSGCEKAEKLHPNINFDKPMVMETDNEFPGNEHVEKMGSLDDETQAPDENQEDQFQAVCDGRAEETNNVNLAMKDISETILTKAGDNAEGTPYADELGAEFANANSDGNIELDEPVTSKGCVTEKSNKSLGKRKSVQSVSGKRKSEDGLNREEPENKMHNQKIPLTKADDKAEGTPYADEVEAKFANANNDGKNEFDEPATSKGSVTEKSNKSLGQRKSVQSVSGKRKSKEELNKEEPDNKMKNQKMPLNKENTCPSSSAEAERTTSSERVDISSDVENKNIPVDKKKPVPLVSGKRKSKEEASKKESENKKKNKKIGLIKVDGTRATTAKIKKTPALGKEKSFTEAEKENRSIAIHNPNIGERIAKAASSFKKTPMKIRSEDGVSDRGSVCGPINVKCESTWFILTGHKLQRKEFLQVIKRLKGRVCRDSHQWSYQATHLIYPDPLRRTEKFFAAAASGRWILKTEYLAACTQEGKFLAEEPYEWHKKGLSEDLAINLEAPRKWRLLRERTGHGAFYGMHIIIYGECIAPPLDTLKRVIKAGDGIILATSPPYTRFLNSGVDYAIVSPGMPRVDMWVQEFLRHEIPCVLADYLVEYVCKPGYPLEKHVQYNTQAWAERSFTNLQIRSQEVVSDKENSDNDVDEDVRCQVCGSRERGEVMLICGDESGNLGCGVGTHIDCCKPSLESVPNEDWFCLKCSESESKKSKSRSKGTTKKGRSLLPKGK